MTFMGLVLIPTAACGSSLPELPPQLLLSRPQAFGFGLVLHSEVRMSVNSGSAIS